MTPDEWIPVGEAAELIGEPIDRLFKLLEQGVIESEIPGRGVSRQSADIWAANQKAPRNDVVEVQTAPHVPVVVPLIFWTPNEEKILAKLWYRNTTDYIGRKIGRSAESIRKKGNRLIETGKLHRIEPGYVTTLQAAKMLSVQPQVVRSLLKGGGFDFYYHQHHPGKLRISKKSIRDYIAAQKEAGPVEESKPILKLPKPLSDLLDWKKKEDQERYNFIKKANDQAQKGLTAQVMEQGKKILELREERNRLKKDLTDLVDLYKDQGHRIAELTADVADRDAAIIGLNEDLEELNFHLSEARAQLAKIEEEKTPKENLKNKLARLRSLFPGEKQ